MTISPLGPFDALRLLRTDGERSRTIGVGVGLRTEHYEEILAHWPQMDWFEAISENFMDSGGRPRWILEQVRARYPVGLHGVSLSIGSADPLNENYLAKLKALADAIEPAIVSDHLCWTGVKGRSLHDLLPLPFTEEAVNYLVDRISKVQEFLGRRILIENVSSYVTYRHSVIPEWEFISAAAKRSGCGILLDVNNVYVNSKNHGFDPHIYLKNLPRDLIGQIHLAGHTDMGEWLFDTHSAPVIEPVWGLYREALELFGPVTTLIEWDAEIPPFVRLAEEAERAREIYAEAKDQPKRCQAPTPTLTLPLQDEGGGEGWGQASLVSPSLAETEQWMLSQIHSELHIGGAGEIKESGRIFLNPQGRASGIERLSVYSEGYRARFHEAFKEVYEAVLFVLGADYFQKMVDDYLQKYPSSEYNLSFVGKYLSEFFETYPLTQDLPFLPDLAKLEWFVIQSFHAAQRPPLDASHLAGLQPEEWNDLILIFQPSVRILASRWPIHEIWKARKEPPEEVKIHVENRPAKLLIARNGFKVSVEPIDDAAFQLLPGLLEGKTLGQVSEEIADFADSPEKISTTFSDWQRRGLLAGYRLAKSTISSIKDA